MDFTALYCEVDDFMKTTFKNQASYFPMNSPKRGPERRLSDSEMVSILIGYHQSCFRHFKGYYLHLLAGDGKQSFPNLVSYNRFVELMGSVWLALLFFMESRKGVCSGTSFIDSTSMAVCKNLRIPRNKVFAGLAKRGKTTMGWFFGFKLHLVINEVGDILAYQVTFGNTDDRSPVLNLTKKVFGKLFGDKGYISEKLTQSLLEKNIRLITGIKSNMKNKLMPMMDKLLLRKRFIIETINDQLKNISDLEHSRHRSPFHFLINILCALIAYTFQPKKPSISWNTSLVCN